jgi:eukaryotic-like serine/threonine-protein kinase
MKTCPQCNLRYPKDSTYCFVDGAELLEFQDPRIGTTLAGRYRIEDILGEGGMAIVYRAVHTLIGRKCAIKVMNHALARDRVVRERFRREAKAAQKLAHPNIIEIFDHGDTEDGSAYLVMELLEGESLGDVVERGPIPLSRALPILVQISRALSRAHDFEVIHRDMKPENVFLARDPNGGDLVKLLDFGIARSMQDSRLTGAGEVFGTPQYMAPERITSIDAGPAADLYAMGVMAFEMLTGNLPFEAHDIPNYFIKHLKEPAPKLRSVSPNMPQSLEILIDRLLAKDPRQRPLDAHRVGADLLAICKECNIAPPPELTVDSPESVLLAPTLPPGAIDIWVRRTAVFQQMLQTAYSDPTAIPPNLVQLLEQVRGFVQKIREMRQTSMTAQHSITTLETKEREGRQRFGAAMDALGIDASNARDAARLIQEKLTALHEQHLEFIKNFKELHRNVILWEGRTAFQEPYTELASAYRTAADSLDAWQEVRKSELFTRKELETCQKSVVDLEFQIQELRTALGRFEQGVEQEKAQLQASMLEMGNSADETERELIRLATLFCEPLRGRPELGNLFLELESAAAA